MQVRGHVGMATLETECIMEEMIACNNNVMLYNPLKYKFICTDTGLHMLYCYMPSSPALTAAPSNYELVGGANGHDSSNG